VDYSFDSPDVIRIEANLASGWRRLKNTHGFCDRVTAEGIDFKVEVALRAWPNWIGKRINEFPSDITARFTHIPSPENPLIGYELSGARLVLHISIPDSAKGNLPNSHRRGFFLKERIWGPNRLGYWLSVLAYFVECAAQHPDILEFDTQWWQGGLPGLGRR
jgi:hypothetical protein